MYEINQLCDYITASVKAFEPLDDALGRPKPARPLLANYNSAQIFPCGLLLQWHDASARMKFHLTLNGTTMQTTRDIGFTDAQIVAWIAAMKGARFGRIDLAITSSKIDGSAHGFLPTFAHFATLAGWCETKLKLDKPVVDHSLNIETAYIGSRKKREMLRIYDKGLQLGGEADKIIRIEMERRSVANTIARDVTAAVDYGSVIKRYFDFPHSVAWQQIMSAPKSRRTNKERQENQDNADAKNEKLWQWLFSSAAPALARALFADNIDPNTNPAATEFAKIVASEYNRLVDSKLDG